MSTPQTTYLDPDVLERVRDRLGAVPQLELAHPWRVDEQPTVRHQDQLALRRGVPAAAVPASHLAGFLPVGAQQPVDDGGLADPGRPEQGDRLASGQMFLERVGAAVRQAADDVNRRARRQRGRGAREWCLA